MATYSPVVTCYEEHGTQHENKTADDWTASVTLRCAWTSRHSLVNDIVGNRRAWPHSGYGTVPLAQSAAIVPCPAKYTVSGQSCEYDDALVTVNYGILRLDLISESLEPSVEFRQLDYRNFRWASASGDPLIEGEAPGKLVRSLALVRNYYNLTSLHSDLLTLPGKVNQAAYVSSLLGLTFPIETLLFAPGPMSRTITTAGSSGWNLQLKFSYNPNTWNKFWRASYQSWDSIYIAGGAIYRNYPLGDFSNWLS